MFRSTIQFLPASLLKPEMELLVYCCRIHLSEKAIERIKDLSQQRIDWNYMVQIANNHQVIQIVYQNLSQICPNALPKNIRENLKSNYYANLLRNSFLLQELIELQGLLDKHNLKAIFFKGAALAISAYGNEDLRQYNDIDILVEENYFQTTADLLTASGYELSIDVPWEIHLSKNELCSIDLHRYIVPQHLCCSLNADYIWNNVKSIALSDRQIPVLSPEVELLVLCLNGAKECWRNLNRICDVDAVIQAHPQLNWIKIIQHADEHGFKRIILLGVLLAHRYLETPIPEVVWQQQDGKILSLMAEVDVQLALNNFAAVDEIERTLFHIKARERWQDQLQSLLGLLNHSGWMTITPKDREFLPLPKWLGFLYYLIRPLRILQKYKFDLLKYFKFSK